MADLPAVALLQRACYGAPFQEPVEAFASKLASAPETIWVAQQGADLLAYLVCLPVAAGALPALHGTHWSAPSEPAWLYVHDLAIAPQARRTGLAGALLGCAHQAARRLGLPDIGLIAVQDSTAFWARLGFVAAPDWVDGSKLRTYGDGACFMRCATTELRVPSPRR